MINILSGIIKRIFLSALFIFLIVSCSPPKQSSRNRYVNHNPDMTIEIKKAIRDGDIIRGMNEEQVLASWASPILKWLEAENNKKYKVWTYPDMQNSPFVNIYFDNDIVIKIVKVKNLPQVE